MAAVAGIRDALDHIAKSTEDHLERAAIDAAESPRRARTGRPRRPVRVERLRYVV